MFTVTNPKIVQLLEAIHQLALFDKVVLLAVSTFLTVSLCHFLVTWCQTLYITMNYRSQQIRLLRESTEAIRAEMRNEAAKRKNKEQ